MRINREPCQSCPYRVSCPSGVWAAEEYEKLRRYDYEYDADGRPELATFLCHLSSRIGETVCRGWLAVHSDSLAVRLMQIRGKVTADELRRKPLARLYASGNAAADAGLRGIRRPGRNARAMAARLIKRGVGR